MPEYCQQEYQYDHGRKNVDELECFGVIPELQPAVPNKQLM